MQDIGREGDQGSARPLRAINAVAGLQHQIAALIARRIGQLQAERDLARLDIMAAQIDVPVVMAAS